MSIVDHLIVLFLAVAVPVNQFLARHDLHRLLDYSTMERVALYRRFVFTQWGATIVLVLVWRGFDRAYADLGFVLDFGRGFWIALAIAAGSLGGLWLYYRWQLRSENRRARLRRLLERLAPFMPRTPEAMPAFDALSVTAGICEEIIYRGYFIWYAMQFFGTDARGLVISVIATSAVFGIGHLYQGPRGMVMVFATGLVHGVVYVIAGSLWIAMALHAVMDLMAGRVALRLHDE